MGRAKVSELFITVREEWNRYLLSDKTELKLKISMSGVTVQGKYEATGTGQAASSFTPVFYKEPSSEDKGQPSTPPVLTDSDPLRELGFETQHESINIYDVPSIRNLLICRPQLAKIYASDKFDQNGSRIYRYETKMLLAVVPYPKVPKESTISTESAATDRTVSDSPNRPTTA